MNNLIDYLKNFEGEKILMTVFPHPDDETMATGGLLQAAKSLGWKTVVVAVTAGGAGQVHVIPNGRSLVDIRKLELQKATKILGVDALEIGKFEDGRLKVETGWGNWVDRVIEKYKPGLVVTYDPSGFYGHPDHIAVSKYLFKHLTSNPSPEFRRGELRGEVEGARGASLLFVAIPKVFRDKLKIRGMDQVKEMMVEPTHKLNLGWKFVNKWRAMKAHGSQNLKAFWPVEYYHLVAKGVKYRYKYIDYEII